MIKWVLDSIVALSLRHLEFLWQGTGIDGYREWRVNSIPQIVKAAGDASLEGVHHDLIVPSLPASLRKWVVGLYS